MAEEIPSRLTEPSKRTNAPPITGIICGPGGVWMMFHDPHRFVDSGGIGSTRIGPKLCEPPTGSGSHNSSELLDLPSDLTWEAGERVNIDVRVTASQGIDYVIEIGPTAAVSSVWSSDRPLSQDSVGRNRGT